MKIGIAKWQISIHLSLILYFNFNIKLYYFRFIDSVIVSHTMSVNNPRWLAPEIALCGEKYTKAADVYPFGIILWEILTWKVPFDEDDDDNDTQPNRKPAHVRICAKLMQKERPRIPSPEEIPEGNFIYN